MANLLHAQVNWDLHMANGTRLGSPIRALRCNFEAFQTRIKQLYQYTAYLSIYLSIHPSIYLSILHIIYLLKSKNMYIIYNIRIYIYIYIYIDYPSVHLSNLSNLSPPEMMVTLVGPKVSTNQPFTKAVSDTSEPKKKTKVSPERGGNRG